MAVVLISVWEIKLPLPAYAPLMLPAGTVLMVHVYVVEPVVLDKTILVVPVEQIAWEGGAAVTVGIGLTVSKAELLVCAGEHDPLIIQW